MLFQVNGFSLQNLQKANSDLVKIDIIANHLTEDSDDETVLKEAFSPETIKEFLDNGVIDFWHDSKNKDLSKEERNAAIIGKPISFRWENGKPVVTAQLTKSHHIVKDMLPHLEAGQPVYAASIGGSKMILETKDADGKTHRIIPKIRWDHLAIAPAPYVINREAGMNVRLLQKANDIMCEFDNLQAFKINGNIIERESELRKALLAPQSSGDLYTTPGGSITKQSIEKKPVNLTLSENDGLDLIDTIIGIKEKRIPMKKSEYINHFKTQNKEDFGHKSYDLIDKYFKLKNRS